MMASYKKNPPVGGLHRGDRTREGEDTPDESLLVRAAHYKQPIVVLKDSGLA